MPQRPVLVQKGLGTLMAFALVASASVISMQTAGAAAPNSLQNSEVFVAYSPLLSGGGVNGANTVEGFSVTPPSAPTSLGTANVGAQPVAAVAAPDGSSVYVVNATSDSITQIGVGAGSAGSPQAEATITLPSGYNPTGIAIAPNGSAGYVVATPSLTNTRQPAMFKISLASATFGQLLATTYLPATSSPAGIAITPSGSMAYITDYSASEVLVVQLSTLRLASPISLGGAGGAGPLGIAMTPDGSAAYVADSESGQLSRIALSCAVNCVTSVALELGFSPQQVAISPDGTEAWVTEDNAANANTPGFVIPVAIGTAMTPNAPVVVGSNPNGVAMSPDGSTVYVANETAAADPTNLPTGSITAVDTSTLALTTTIVSADPTALVVTPDQAPIANATVTAGVTGQNSCFSSAGSISGNGQSLTYTWNFGDGSSLATSGTPCHVYQLPGTYTATLTVADASGTSTDVVYTGQSVLRNGGASASDEVTVTVERSKVDQVGVAYFVDGTTNSVTPVLSDPTTVGSAGTVGLPIGVGTHPVAIAITPSATEALVVNYGSNDVTPIDLTTGLAAAHTGWIAVGSEPVAVAINPNGKFAYVANSGDGTVSVISLSTNQVTETFTVGGSPSSLAVSHDGTMVYVTNNGKGYDDVQPINLVSGRILPGVGTGIAGVNGGAFFNPVAIATSPSGSVAYVVDRGSPISNGSVTVLQLSGALVTPIANSQYVVPPTPSGANPSSIAVAANGSSIVIGEEGNALSPNGFVVSLNVDHTAPILGMVDPTSAVMTAVGVQPSGVAIAPDSSTTFVANSSALNPAAATGSVFTLPGGSPNATAAGAGADAVAVTPDLAPSADLQANPSAANTPTSFSATNTTFPSLGSGSRLYTWSFGDGTPPESTQVPMTSHVYAHGGSYHATVTVADGYGTANVASQAFTGQTMSLAGAASADADVTVAIPDALPVVTGITPSSFDAGNGPISVIVYGSNFFDVASVQIGSVSVARSDLTISADGTQITGVLASTATPGSVDATVTNGAGTSVVTPQDVFTVTDPSTAPSLAPTVASLSLQYGPLSGGTGLTINGSNFTDATLVNFGATATTNFIVSSDGTQITVVTPQVLTPGTIDVTVSTPVATSLVNASDAFTYEPAPSAGSMPTVTSITPNTGLVAGLGNVTVTGSNFNAVEAVHFGGVPATAFFVNSPTSLTVIVPPAVGPGTVDLTVTTADEQSAVVPADAYTYASGATNAGPVVQTVTPATGTIAGGTTLVIHGVNFFGLAPTGSVQLGGVDVASFSVNSAGTEIVATTPATPSPRSVDVVVTNSLASSATTAADVFSYTPDSLNAPVIASVSPASGDVSGGTAITVTGTGFTNASLVTIGGQPITSFTVSGDGTELSFASPVAATPGTVTIAVTTSGGQSDVSVNDSFTYLTDPGAPGRAVVTGVNPITGPVAGNSGVEIDGSNFLGATAVFFGTSEAQSFMVNADGTTILAISPFEAMPVNVDVTVVTSAGVSDISLSDRFTFVATPIPNGPVVTSVVAASCPQVGGTLLRIGGTGLSGALTVAFNGQTTPVVSVNQAGTIVTAVTPRTHLLGTVPVSVETPLGQSAITSLSHFTFESSAPTIATVSPVSGGQASGAVVQVTGTNFANGATTVTLGGLSVTNVTVNGAGTLLSFTQPEFSSSGTKTLAISNEFGAATSTYTVVSSAPTVLSVSPRQAAQAGGATITLSGANFAQPDFGVTVDGSPALNLTVLPGGTGLSFTMPRTLTVGSLPVVISNRFGSTSTTVTAFSSAPSILRLSNASGPLTGGGTITVLGGNLQYVTSVTFGSLAASVTAAALDGSSLTVSVPAQQWIGSVSLVVTSPFGTAATSASNSYRYLPSTVGFHPVAPTQLFDSRDVVPSVKRGTHLTIHVAGVGQVPISATAVAVNVSIPAPAQPGAIAVGPTGSPALARTVTVNANAYASRFEVLSIGTNGNIDLTGLAGAERVILGLEGYFATSTNGVGSLVPVQPFVAGAGGTAVTVRSTAPVVLGLVGRGALPTGAASAALVSLSVAGGNVRSTASIVPAGTPGMPIRDVEWAANQPVETLAIVPLQPDGHVVVRIGQGSARVTVTVLGYFRTAAVATSGAGLLVGGLAGAPSHFTFHLGPNGKTSFQPIPTTGAGAQVLSAGPAWIIADVVVSTTAPSNTVTFDPSGRPINTNVATEQVELLQVDRRGRVQVTNGQARADISVAVEAYFGGPQ